MDLPKPLAWLVDEASASAGPDRFLAELGSRMKADGLPLAAGSLTLAVPHPIIARRSWLWRAESGAVIEALGFTDRSLSQMGRDALNGLSPVEVDVIGEAPDSPVLAWAGARPFTSDETLRLREVARFAAAPLAALASRGAMAALLEAYLGKRSAARVQAGALRRGTGETIFAALLFYFFFSVLLLFRCHCLRSLCSACHYSSRYECPAFLRVPCDVIIHARSHFQHRAG